MKYIISESQYSRLSEQATVSGAIDLIKNNLPTIVGIILSLVPTTLIPRIIYYVVSGKGKDLYNELSGYKNKIEQALKSKKINLTLQDITNNLMSIAKELEAEIKRKAGL